MRLRPPLRRGTWRRASPRVHCPDRTSRARARTFASELRDGHGRILEARRVEPHASQNRDPDAVLLASPAGDAAGRLLHEDYSPCEAH
ncbi:MAG: hypothetical protein IT303_14070, partial [Dehalococcoidia bacterium]|nr:hypothetical protein [Dehalococcoidia bacterium]